MADNLNLRRMTPADTAAVMAVARLLPEWFNADGLKHISIDIHNQMGAVAEVEDDVVGFICWLSRGGIGEIGWIGVAPDHHRNGIGERLLAFAENHLRTSGVREMQVETLGESVDYEPYERTRAFYRAEGFRFLRSEMTDSPGMPESLWLRKPIAPPAD